MQNSVIRLKSNILTAPKFLGWLRYCPGRLKNRSGWKNRQWEPWSHAVKRLLP